MNSIFGIKYFVLLIEKDMFRYIVFIDEWAKQRYNLFVTKAAEWPRAERHEESPGTAGQDAC